MIVAIVGVDGSGKSAVSQRVYKELIRKGKRVKLFHVDKYFLFQPMVNIIRGSKQGQNPLLTTQKKPLVYQFWPLLALIDHSFRYFYFSILSLLGHVVLCDRYFYDKLLSFKYFGYANSITFKVALVLTLPPKRTVYLDVSPETAQKREIRDTHTADFYFKMLDHYRDLAKDKKFILINGEETLGKVVSRVMEEI